MKVLLINRSPRKEGNTYLALSEMASALQAYRLTESIRKSFPSEQKRFRDVSLADGVLNWDGAYSRMHFTRK